MNIAKIQEQLCGQLCHSVRVRQRDNGLVIVDNPFTFPDGDSLPLYLSSLPGGGYKLSDLGSVVVRLSYDDSNVDKYFNPRKPQGKRLRQILDETGVRESNGEFYVEFAADALAENILKFSQVLTQIYDLGLLSRMRSISTFYEELQQAIRSSLDGSLIKEEHFFACDKEKRYPTDFYLQSPDDAGRTLCVYGIPSKDKAQLVTIVLQYLQKNGEQHNNLLVFPEEFKISQSVLNRLQEASGEGKSSTDAGEGLTQALKQGLYNGSGAHLPGV